MGYNFCMNACYRKFANRLQTTVYFFAPILLSIQTCFAQPPANCQCLWQGSFSKAYIEADAVVVAEILTGKGNSLDIKVEEILADTDKRVPAYLDSIRIWGDNGQLCRPNADDFVPGTRWVMALNQISEVPENGFDPATPNISFGRENDFYLSQCGSFWLRVQGSVVTGNLVSDRRWSWKDENSQPVSLTILKRFIAGEISAEVLENSARQPDQLKQLMKQTRQFLHQQ